MTSPLELGEDYGQYGATSSSPYVASGYDQGNGWDVAEAYWTAEMVHAAYGGSPGDHYMGWMMQAAAGYGDGYGSQYVGYPPVAVGGSSSSKRVSNKPDAKAKRRYCTSFPHVGSCRRGNQCAFAHSREDIGEQFLFSQDEEDKKNSVLTNDFFVMRYKTKWCPIGTQHEWHTCVYAHNYQDARRPVHIGYGWQLCQFWNKKDTSLSYGQRCPLGVRCPCAHGAKEQLYHPLYFKTVICRDVKAKVCPRQKLCAFYHNKQERRPAKPVEVDYTEPLREQYFTDDQGAELDWVREFLSPPFSSEERPCGGFADDGDDMVHTGGSMCHQPELMIESEVLRGAALVFLPVKNVRGGLSDLPRTTRLDELPPHIQVLRRDNWTFHPGMPLSEQEPETC